MSENKVLILFISVFALFMILFIYGVGSSEREYFEYYEDQQIICRDYRPDGWASKHEKTCFILTPISK